jgi:hypothetical protein
MTAMEKILDGLLLAYFVEKLRFQSCWKNYRPVETSLHFGRGGTRDLILRATKNLLIGLPTIHWPNWRSRFSLARKCSECIFEFFNTIGRPGCLEAAIETYGTRRSLGGPAPRHGAQ